MGTGLFPLGCSPIQKMVVTIFVFHGYRRAGREDTASCLAENAVEFTVKRGSPDDFRMRGLPFSVTPKAFGANAGSKARKIAKEKRPSEQRFSITFQIGSHSEIAWIAAEVYFTIGEVECENQASASVLPFLRSLITKVLLSPKVDHGPCGTSLKSTNFQSVTSVSFNPR